MRQLWELVAGFLETLWDTGNFLARLAIVVVLGWPVALTLAVLGGVKGDVAVFLALIPAVALVLFLLVIPPMLPVLVMALPAQPFDDVRFLRRIRFPSRAERLRALKRALKFLTLVAGIESAIGIFVAGVPVWNDPGLLLWLFAFTIVFMLMWFGGVRHKWLTRSFVIVFLIITAAFFAGGREGVRGWKEERQRRKAEQIVAVQTERAPKEFSLNAGEEKPTVRNGAETIHRIQANKTWIAIAADNTGKVVEYPMPAGASRWGGSEPEDLLWVRGVEDGTTLRFERE